MLDFNFTMSHIYEVVGKSYSEKCFEASGKIAKNLSKCEHQDCCHCGNLEIYILQDIEKNT